MVAKQFHGMYDYIPNTLSTTAHIQTLLFQPGSGAYGSDGPYVSAAPPFTSTPQPSLRGTLPTTAQALPRSMSIVGIAARTYQDTLEIPFAAHFENLTRTSGGGDAPHEASSSPGVQPWDGSSDMPFQCTAYPREHYGFVDAFPCWEASRSARDV